ncbi:EVE domain-containing protein [Halioxenophilus aromaticivorans]|uniref:EVE domain-containing protein n=1 Tax=Halioxenophilus aromaticivorans TaxID=1306992 RepID=A0AAV3U9M6_9ALTE
MTYWLFKSEPDEYSIDDLAAEPNKTGRWDGIRNYQARNLIRDDIGVGDQILFYHSSCKVPAVVGTATVTQTAYPDPAQYDGESRYFDPKATQEKPRWYCVDIQFLHKFKLPVPLKHIKQDAILADMVLVNQGRLSVQPVTEREWEHITVLGNADT